MAPAGREDDGAVSREPLEPGIAVHLQDAAEAGKVLGRPCRGAVGRIDEHHGRMTRPTPGSVVPGVGPEPSDFGLSPSGIEHRQGRVVGKHPRARHDVGDHTLVQRFQPLAGRTHPVRKGRAGNGEPVPVEDLALPI